MCIIKEKGLEKVKLKYLVAKKLFQRCRNNKHIQSDIMSIDI
jgi:hypothetical protein